MKIVVISGSPRRRDSYKVIKSIEEEMCSKGDVEFEYIKLNEYNIKECVGCMKCLMDNEDLCPLKDDTQAIRDKLVNADGIIFASPVYAITVTGTMKKVVDRLGYIFHRPELVGKPAITVSTSFGGGLKSTQKYLKMIATGWGCLYKGEISVAAPIYFEDSKYYSEKYYNKTSSKITNIANTFYKSVIEGKKPTPTFYELYLFQGFKSKTYMSKADYNYWNDKGWLTNDYYYDVKLNPLKKAFSASLGWLIKMAFKKYYNTNVS